MSFLFIYNLLLKLKSYFWEITKMLHAVSCYRLGKQIFFYVFYKVCDHVQHLKLKYSNTIQIY